MTIAAEPASRLARGRRQSRLETVERLLEAAEASSVENGHPLPDLTGADPADVAEALVATVVAAHAEEWPSPLSAQSSMQLCPRCIATVEMAAKIAERNDPVAWPSPLLVVIDEALESQDAKQAERP